MTSQDQLDSFLIRAKFTYGWENLESTARRMVEHAITEIDHWKSIYEHREQEAHMLSEQIIKLRTERDELEAELAIVEETLYQRSLNDNKS